MMLIGKLTKEHLHNSNLLQMIGLPTLLFDLVYFTRRHNYKNKLKAKQVVYQDKNVFGQILFTLNYMKFILN